jgi:RNA polymerase sigma factor (sigma-70 family)
MKHSPNPKKQRSGQPTFGDRNGHPKPFHDSTFGLNRGRCRSRPPGNDLSDPELALGGGWMRVGHVARLSPEEECALAERVKMGDSDAQTQLIIANLPFVFRAVRRYRKSGMSLDELVQEGSLGLTRAARTFDPAIYSASFATYARYWVRYYLARAVVNNGSVVPLSQHVMRLRLRFRRALRELKAKRPANGSDAGPKTFSLSEIARHMGVSKLMLKRAILFAADRSAALGDIPAEDRTQPEELIAGEEQRAVIHGALERLNPFEAWLLCRRYGVELLKPFPWTRRRTEGNSSASLIAGGESPSDSPLEAASSVKARTAMFHLSFKEIAQECGLKPHRVRQIHHSVLGKLRAALERHFPDGR